MSSPDPTVARQHGTTVHDVTEFGAVGDGRSDDTVAFQHAIDALPSRGGMVLVPPPRGPGYLIDPTVSIRMRSRTALVLDGAKLIAAPNDDPRAYVVTVEDVEDVTVMGGRTALGCIQGERRLHVYRQGFPDPASNRHEHGHGIAVRGSRRVTLADLGIVECTGDGVSVGVGSEDVVIRALSCARNRRQGLTIGRVVRVRVLDSEFVETGDLGDGTQAGTKPMAGIDIEPDSPGLCQDVEIARCRMLRNTSGGVVTYTAGPNAQESAVLRDVRLVDCLMEGNSSGLYATRCEDLELVRCTVQNNRERGVTFHNGTTVANMADCVLRNNMTRALGELVRPEPRRVFGLHKDYARDVARSADAGATNVGLNEYA